jgi:hypothetical protein
VIFVSEKPFCARERSQKKYQPGKQTIRRSRAVETGGAQQQQRERDRETNRDRERDRECVCVREGEREKKKERERERELCKRARYPINRASLDE